jgi:hypothetical protein
VRQENVVENFENFPLSESGDNALYEIMRSEKAFSTKIQ